MSTVLHTGFRRLGKYVMYGSIVAASLVLLVLMQSPAGFPMKAAFTFLLISNVVGETLYEGTKDRTRVGHPIMWFVFTSGVATMAAFGAVMIPVYAPAMEGGTAMLLSLIPASVMLAVGAVAYAMRAVLFHVADGFRSR